MGSSPAVRLLAAVTRARSAGLTLPDAEMRRQGLSVLIAHGGATARQHLLGALRDPDRLVM